MGSKFISKDGELTADEKAAENLAAMLSQEVLRLMDRAGMSQTVLAGRLGYSRASLNQVLHARGGNRLWRLPAVCGVARVFNVSVLDLLTEAFAPSASGVPLSLVARTAPRTMDRLDKLVRAVAPAGTEKGVLDFFYTAQMFEVAAPGYVKRYHDGQVSDADAYALLKEAAASEDPETNLWGEVKRRVGHADGGPFSPAK